jgi:uncharacterized FlaG/YvyC family protein
MDIKSALNQVIPINLRVKDPVQKALKTDSTTDRDANGQQAFGEQKQSEREPMSEEQLKKALDHLHSLSVVKENGLQLELIESEGKKFVLLKEPSGKVIRRIPEHELWSLQIMQEDKRGQLLNRSA